MKRITLASLVLLTAAAATLFAANPPALRVKLISIGEISLAPNEDLKVEDSQALFPIEGRAKGAFYLVVKLSRELPENACSDVKGISVMLTSGGGPTVAPYAVAAIKRDIDGESPTYPASEKKRWVSELWYFPVAPGQRDWTVTINDEPAGRVLDFFATLIVRNAGDVSTRLTLPDGSKPVLGADQTQRFALPVGSCEIPFEVRLRGKGTLPWRKLDRGDVKLFVVCGDPRNAPVIAADNLRAALPRFEKAWQLFHAKSGIGGGGYNISGGGEQPVHVGIEFGRDGVAGGISKIWSDRIRVEVAPEEAAPKKGRKSKESYVPTLFINDPDGLWRIERWEKAAEISVSEDAKKIVGQVVVGSFVVRSTEGNPSLWAPDGLLQKGVLFEKGLGDFRAEAKREGDLILVFGEATK